MAKAFQVDTGGTLTTGLRFWYNLEADATDEFSTRNGTLVNIPTFAPGKIGNGIDLEKDSAHYVSIPNSAFVWGTANMSISLWAKHETTTGSQVFMMVNDADGGEGIWFYHDGTNMNVIKNGATGAQQTLAHAYSRDTDWHHWVAVYGSVVGHELWLDGVRVANNATLTNAIADPVGVAVFMGAYSNNGSPTAGFYFDGIMDLVGVYSKALSSTEIADLYNGGAGNAYQEQASSPKTITGIMKSRRFRGARWPRVRMGKVERWQDIP